MKKIIVLCLIPTFCQAFSPACLKKIIKVTKISEEKLTEMFMSCGNAFLETETLYLGDNKAKTRLIRKYHPVTQGDDEEPHVSETEKVDRIMFFNSCQKNNNLIRRLCRE